MVKKIKVICLPFSLFLNDSAKISQGTKHPVPFCLLSVALEWLISTDSTLIYNKLYKLLNKQKYRADIKKQMID